MVRSAPIPVDPSLTYGTSGEPRVHSPRKGGTDILHLYRDLNPDSVFDEEEKWSISWPLLCCSEIKLSDLRVQIKVLAKVEITVCDQVQDGDGNGRKLSLFERGISGRGVDSLLLTLRLESPPVLPCQCVTCARSRVSDPVVWGSLNQKKRGELRQCLPWRGNAW